MPSNAIRLSVIIPAFNESMRLPQFAKDCRVYLEAHFPGAWEIWVVDDGSSDDTARVAAAQVGEAFVIKFARNLGKGAAVRAGMLRANGALCLFADADGATAIGEEARLRQAIEEGADIAIGSRMVQGKRNFVAVGTRQSLQTQEKAPRWKVRPHRHYIGRTFSLIIKSLVGLSYRDTQCGFKMFRRETVEPIFGEMQTNRFAFDVEILVRAKHLNYRVNEVGVSWSEKPGSKVNLFTDSLKMFFEVLAIRRTLSRRR